MARFPQKPGHKGSLRCIQKVVNDFPETLNTKIRAKLELSENLQLEWRSPLVSDDYAEYRDQAFLNLLDIPTRKTRLKDFWPAGGPQWDALGKTKDGKVFLVEAKSHIPEVLSHLAAKSPSSITKINESLNRTKRALHVKTSNNWSSPFYQHANRIAHLYFLRELNDVPAYLIFVYFLNDETVGGPKSEDEWLGTSKLIHSYLGVGRHRLSKYITEIFIDVRVMGKGIQSNERQEDGLWGKG